LGDPGARDYLLQAPETKSFELALAPGQRLAFRLRANPTAKHWREEGGELKARRDPLMREEEQRAWLERKGAAGGFGVLHLTIADEGTLRGRTAGDTRHALRFRAVRFEGVLEVLDPDQLWLTVQNGIGSGKSFGFGLLSLAPAP
jgi:CRISPR system Cascade subunit CasE